MNTVDGYNGPERRGAAAETLPERRQHPRFAVDAWAEVVVLDGSLLFRGRVLDISLAGCYIETRARLRMRQRTPVEMIFRVNDTEFRVRATSRLVRSGMGAGFMFSNVDEETQEDLETLIAQLNAPSKRTFNGRSR